MDAPFLILAKLSAFYRVAIGDQLEFGPKEIGGFDLFDFGTAGPGDPAVDIALLVNTYGESIVQRLARAYPISPNMLDRARFLAGALELEWALAGVSNNDQSMFLVHLGRARDILPNAGRRLNMAQSCAGVPRLPAPHRREPGRASVLARQ
jgi:hypothetical protein